MEIQRIELLTTKLDQQIEFYTQQLGFGLLEYVADQSFSVNIGASVLRFVKTDEFETVNYHFAFNIPHNQIDQAIQFLMERNIQFYEFEGKKIIDFPNWNAQAIYFKDEEQNIVEMIARRELDNASSSVFSLESITEISEIGFPAQNVKDFYELIQQDFDIPVYSHISNMKSFCAAGNPQGLFIIVPLDRAWFPTKILNGIFPTTVWIKSKEKKIRQILELPYYIESEV